MTDELIGTQLGQYHLTELVRRGGMATVYKAHQPSLDRYVAVKVLFHNRDPQFAMRFKREARAIAQLQHPNILPIYDYGEQDGLLYLVLQYVEQGTTLTDKMGGPMLPITALRLTGRLLGGLEYAHARGIIHRDLKPANVLMPAPDWPMLADFGIAKLLNDTGQQLTMPGLVVGTATYMAPEQATGRQVDARTDLYAIGVMLYEMLTGHVPFDADTPMAVLTQHLYEPPAPLSRTNPDVPAIVEAAVLRALAKDPADRYQTAAEMAEELESVVGQLRQNESRTRITGLYQAGVQAFADGQWDRAVEQLGRLAALDPDYEDAADLLAAAQAERERAREEARRQIEQVRKRRSTSHQQVQSSMAAEPAVGETSRLAEPPPPAIGETTRFDADQVKQAAPPAATNETHRLPAVGRETSRLDVDELERTAGGTVAANTANLLRVADPTEQPAPAREAGPAAAWGSSAGTARSTAVTPAPTSPADTPAPRRSPLLIGVGALAVIGIIVAGLWFSGVFGQPTAGPTPTSAAPTGGPVVVAATSAASAPTTAPEPTAPDEATAAPAAALPPPTGQLIAQDEFKDRGVESGLEDLVNDPIFQRGYHPDKGEVYHLKVVRDQDTRAVYFSRQLYTNFNMQIEMWDFSDDFSGSVRQGVVFRVRDPNHYYAFLVDPRAGQYTVRKREGPDTWTDLIAWKPSDLIKRNQDHNMVRVDATGDQFTIYLNDQQLDTFSDATYTSGMLGMIVDNQDAEQPHMHFDNFKAWSDDPPPAASTLPPDRKTPNGDMALIPGGEFIMGANEESDAQPTVVDVPDFYIDQKEVTNAEYAKCISAGKCTPQQQPDSELHPNYATQADYANYPAIYVGWQQARDYCGWAGKRLPTEAEWEKAASWDSAARKKTAWPWGNVFDSPKVNSSEANLRDTSAAGAYPAGTNNLFDMAGNVSEWTNSLYKPYPYAADDGREDAEASGDRVYRGGSWGQSRGKVRVSFRQSSSPERGDREIGFRCVAAP